jgi:hypothetical protein
MEPRQTGASVLEGEIGKVSVGTSASSVISISGPKSRRPAARLQRPRANAFAVGIETGAACVDAGIVSVNAGVDGSVARCFGFRHSVSCAACGHGTAQCRARPRGESRPNAAARTELVSAPRVATRMASRSGPHTSPSLGKARRAAPTAMPANSKEVSSERTEALDHLRSTIVRLNYRAISSRSTPPKDTP